MVANPLSRGMITVVVFKLFDQDWIHATANTLFMENLKIFSKGLEVLRRGWKLSAPTCSVTRDGTTNGLGRIFTSSRIIARKLRLGCVIRDSPNECGLAKAETHRFGFKPVGVNSVSMNPSFTQVRSAKASSWLAGCQMSIARQSQGHDPVCGKRRQSSLRPT